MWVECPYRRSLLWSKMWLDLWSWSLKHILISRSSSKFLELLIMERNYLNPVYLSSYISSLASRTVSFVAVCTTPPNHCSWQNQSIALAFSMLTFFKKDDSVSIYVYLHGRNCWKEKNGLIVQMIDDKISFIGSFIRQVNPDQKVQCF
jgi:hypothetical protein